MSFFLTIFDSANVIKFVLLPIKEAEKPSL